MSHLANNTSFRRRLTIFPAEPLSTLPITWLVLLNKMKQQPNYSTNNLNYGTQTNNY